jgi:hypothetical protein
VSDPGCRHATCPHARPGVAHASVPAVLVVLEPRDLSLQISAKKACRRRRAVACVWAAILSCQMRSVTACSAASRHDA